MTVKELIKKLEQYDPDLDVWVADEIEGNSCPMTGISIYKKPSDMIVGGSLVDALYIRWSDDYEEHKYYIHHYSEAKQKEIRDCGYLIKEDGLICWSQEQIDRIKKEGNELYEKLMKDPRHEPATSMDD